MKRLASITLLFLFVAGLSACTAKQELIVEGPDGFTVTDEDGLSDSESITIDVIRCNKCPELEDVDTQNLCVGETKNIQLVGTDVNGDPITYSAIPMPEGAEICDWNGIFSWTPTCDQVGTKYITMKAADDLCGDSKLVKFIVDDCGQCNSQPDLKVIPDKNVCEGCC